MGLRTIGQLAKAAAVAVDTVRYYERIGPLPRRGRAASGWRRYPEEILVRLRYVREGRAACSVSPNGSCCLTRESRVYFRRDSVYLDHSRRTRVGMPWECQRPLDIRYKTVWRHDPCPLAHSI